MSNLFLITSLLSSCSGTPVFAAKWRDFKIQFGKYYSSQEDEVLRRGIFERNLEFIQNQNLKNLSYQLGVNQFTDLSSEEWSSRHFGLGKSEPRGTDALYLGSHVYNGEMLPASVDWVAKGAVTPVKEPQGKCGACWAFSATGSLEGAYQIATGSLVSLSEQQLVDCAWVTGGECCDGGYYQNAWRYAKKNSMCTEQSYPYTSKCDWTHCNASKCEAGYPTGNLTGFKNVPGSNMVALMSAVAQQPVSVAVCADSQIFQHYKIGVLSGDCGGDIDHAMLVVGYGTDANGVDYWKVKNSFGKTWGMDGYILMPRGVSGEGACGILHNPAYPIVSVAEPLSEDTLVSV